MKIVTIVGARPQFIKAGVVNRAIQSFNSGSSRKKRIEEIFVHTGQHYDYLMDRVFFEELQLPKPDHHLGVGSRSHSKQTGMMLERIESILSKERPEIVVVYGDTNSTLAGALASAKMNIPIAHVEAGLRSYDRTMPEEINRLLTDHVSTFLFCPTTHAVQNLLREGIKNDETRRVRNVGDVMYDSILYYAKLAEKKSPILHHLNLGNRPYYLATLHRAENTDNPERLESILRAFDAISETALVILPLHPRTKKMMKVFRLHPRSRNVKLIEPASYLNMLKLEKHAKAILTDSGGIQKEAYWLRTPCVTLREVTEWGYTTEGGWNTVSGWKTSDILRAIQKISALEKKRKKGYREKKGAGEVIVRLLFQLSL
jgi:UDP-N-acetylglucosamine 2-epimerase